MLEKNNIFGQYREGFVDYNLWKKSCIDVHFHSKYSNSDNKNRKLKRHDLMNELSGKVIQIVDNNYSIFMSDQEIRNSVQMRFKNHVSYKNIKNVNVIFWENVYELWCNHLTRNINDSYDLSNHSKVSLTKRGKKSKLNK